MDPAFILMSLDVKSKNWGTEGILSVDLRCTCFNIFGSYSCLNRGEPACSVAVGDTGGEFLVSEMKDYVLISLQCLLLKMSLKGVLRILRF